MHLDSDWNVGSSFKKWNPNCSDDNRLLWTGHQFSEKKKKKSILYQVYLDKTKTSTNPINISFLGF